MHIFLCRYYPLRGSGNTNWAQQTFFSEQRPYDVPLHMSTSQAPRRSTAPLLSPPASSSDESYEDEVNVVIVEDEVIVGPPKRRTTQGSALWNSTNKRKKTMVEKSTKTRMNELPDCLKKWILIVWMIGMIVRHV